LKFDSLNHYPFLCLKLYHLPWPEIPEDIRQRKIPSFLPIPGREDIISQLVGGIERSPDIIFLFFPDWPIGLFIPVFIRD